MITRTFWSNGKRRFGEICASSSLWIPPIEAHDMRDFRTQLPSKFALVHKRFYSSQYIPRPLCENSHIAPHVQTCLSDQAEEISSAHSGLHVWFLGTGGTLPSQARMTSATLLQLGGQSFLFDAGESIQRQLIYTRQGISLRKIFISHLHADHVLGLFGLLLMLQQPGRSRGIKYELDIYGPPGIYNYIASTLALTRSHVNALKLTIHELVDGTADTVLRGELQQPNIIHGHFPDLFDNRALARKSIERNDDGTWTIQVASISEDTFDVDRGGNRPLNITAAEVQHIKNVQTFGYVVQEPEPSQKIDPIKAKALGVAPGKKYRKLKNGFSVRSDDGLREVKSEQVVIGANRKARKIAIVGDNCGMSPAMADLCRNADVLVHEAVSSVQSEKDAIERGHSSPEMAGSAAREVNAQLLALNHISAGVRAEDLKDLVLRVEEANGGVSHVIPTFDFMELVVPRFGFDSAAK